MEKSSENIWRVRAKFVPLHPLSGKNPQATLEEAFFERIS
jgi:hypothetical protein